MSRQIERPLRVGIVGLGQGAAGVLPTMSKLPEVQLVAIATRNPETRRKFAARYPQARAHPDIASLCKDPEVEAVWVATPNRYHCEHAIELMRAGKHVAVEKPMAVTLDEADRMIAEAERNGVHLLAAHTSSFSLFVRAMRRVALSGEVGRPRSILIPSYTEWMLRPRTAEELAPEAGGGIVHRQAPHQIDALRLLGGGVLRSVRGTVGQWMPERNAPGFYAGHFEFQDRTTATILHNGYGYFVTLELYPEASARWRYDDADRLRMLHAMRDGTRDEEAEKQEFRIGGSRDPSLAAQKAHGEGWESIDDLGEVTLSCERGVIRFGKHGLTVYGDAGRREVDLRRIDGGGTRPALIELYRAVIEKKPLYHSGAWGRATLEATIGLITSSDERREVFLERQVAMPEDYDDDLDAEIGVERKPALATETIG
jgi:phthalate 4,5-cis-dihydrodiol dehydrogenase